MHSCGVWNLMLIFLFYAPGLRFNAVVCSTMTSAISSPLPAANLTTKAITIMTTAGTPTRKRSFHSPRKSSMNHKNLLMIQSETQTTNVTTAILPVTKAVAAAVTSILTTATKEEEAVTDIVKKGKAIESSFSERSTANSLKLLMVANTEATTITTTKGAIKVELEASANSVTSSLFTTKTTIASSGLATPASQRMTPWTLEEKKDEEEWKENIEHKTSYNRVNTSSSSSNSTTINSGSSNNIKTINRFASRDINNATENQVVGQQQQQQNQQHQQHHQQQRLYGSPHEQRGSRIQEHPSDIGTSKQHVRQVQQQVQQQVQRQVPTAVADTPRTSSNDFDHRRPSESDNAGGVDKKNALPVNFSLPEDKLEITITTPLTEEKSVIPNLYDNTSSKSFRQRPPTATNSSEPILSKETTARTNETNTDAILTTMIKTTTTTIRATTTVTAATTTPETTKSILPLAVDGYETVTSQAGTHAYLPCNVKQLVKKPISWLRVRDGHILTVDQTTFIADQRFQSIYVPNPERWSLQIKYVQQKDAGSYECQVSTEPKASAIITLTIVEPKTELVGESTRHVKAGSEVKLRCVISEALEPPLFINWFHNQKQIYLHNHRNWRTEIERSEIKREDETRRSSSILTTTTKRPKPLQRSGFLTTTTKPMLTPQSAASASLSSSSSSSSLSTATATTTTTTQAATTTTEALKPKLNMAGDVEQITTASLIIPSVEKQDSGNYTCSPSNSAPRTFVLHVLNGEFSASAITSGANSFFVRSDFRCLQRFYKITNLAITLLVLGIYKFLKRGNLSAQRRGVSIDLCNNIFLRSTSPTTQTRFIGRSVSNENLLKLHFR